MCCQPWSLARFSASMRASRVEIVPSTVVTKRSSRKLFFLSLTQSVTSTPLVCRAISTLRRGRLSLVGFLSPSKISKDFLISLSKRSRSVTQSSFRFFTTTNKKTLFSLHKDGIDLQIFSIIILVPKMFTLYNSPSGQNIREVNLGRFERILNVHRNNLSRVIHFYRRSNYTVASNHILVRILQNLPSGEGLDLAQYRDRVDDHVDELTRAMELTSPVNVGRSVTPGHFYGTGTEEIILTHSHPFSIGEFRSRWQQEAPLTFLRHPKSDLCLNLPDGESDLGGEGVVVVNVDIPKLACQYRLWREREERVNPGAHHTPMQYVYRHPLTNSLASQVDIAYFNMLRDIFFGKGINDVPHQHPFFLNTNFERTREGLVDVLHSYLNRRISFGEVLESIKPISSASLQEALAIPSMAYTRQVKWALTIARLPLISMMLLWDERTGGSFNRSEIRQVERSLRQLRSDRALSNLDQGNLTQIVGQELNDGIRSFL